MSLRPEDLRPPYRTTARDRRRRRQARPPPEEEVDIEAPDFDIDIDFPAYEGEEDPPVEPPQGRNDRAARTVQRVYRGTKGRQKGCSNFGHNLVECRWRRPGQGKCTAAGRNLVDRCRYKKKTNKP